MLCTATYEALVLTSCCFLHLFGQLMISVVWMNSSISYGKSINRCNNQFSVLNCFFLFFLFFKNTFVYVQARVTVYWRLRHNYMCYRNASLAEQFSQWRIYTQSCHFRIGLTRLVTEINILLVQVIYSIIQFNCTALLCVRNVLRHLLQISCYVSVMRWGGGVILVVGTVLNTLR